MNELKAKTTISNLYPFDFIHLKPKKKAKGTILFIHGFGCDYSYFTAAKILANEYDYYGLNLLGHGKNTIKNDKKLMKQLFNFDSMSNYIVEFIKKHKLNKIILIGHSMGGAIAPIVENKISKKIKKLILISPQNITCWKKAILFNTKFYPQTEDEYYELLTYLFKDVSKWSKHPIFKQAIRRQVEFFSKNINQLKYLGRKVMMTPKTNLLIYYAQKNIKVPTLLCLGEHDGCIPYKSTRKFFNKNIDKLQTEKFSDSSHVCFIEEENKFIKVLKNFLDK